MTEERYNCCSLPINEKYVHAVKYKHPLDYNEWLVERDAHPLPITPTNMLDAIDWHGAEFFAHVRNLLKKYNITGTMLNVGGRDRNNHKQHELFWNLKYYTLNLENPHNFDHNISGDITN